MGGTAFLNVSDPHWVESLDLEEEGKYMSLDSLIVSLNSLLDRTYNQQKILNMGFATLYGFWAVSAGNCLKLIDVRIPSLLWAAPFPNQGNFRRIIKSNWP